MEDYISSLTDEQRNLLSIVQRCELADVDDALDRFPNFAEDEMFSYVLLVTALHRKHKSISIALIRKKCRVVCVTKTNFYSTPLFYAIELGDTSIFKELYRRGASIFDRDANSETPLELAMKNQNSLLLEFIVSQVNFDNLRPDCKEHIAIFHVACYRGHVSVIRKFLERGFSVNSHSDFQLKLWAGATPLQFAMKNSLHKREAVALLLGLDVDLNAQDKQGNTPLHSLVKRLDKNYRNDSVINSVLKTYVRTYDTAKFKNPVNQHGLSHFHILCSVNWDDVEHSDDSIKLMELLKHFIEKGVDLNSSNHLGADEENRVPHCVGYTALHWAARKSSLSVLKLLLENGADPTKTDARGNTPLHVLDFESPHSVDMAKLLLKHGANVDVKNDQNDTPLHCAFYVQKKNEPLLQLLMSASQEVSDIVNNDGLSYLHIASSRDFDKVKTLVEKGASIENRTKSDRGGFIGYSALYFAIISNQVEIVDYLLARGAKVNPITEEYQTTPLHLAGTEEFQYIYDSSGRSTENEDSDAPRGKKISPIDLIKSRESQIRIIQLLLKYGAAVDLKNSNGMTPLLAVCSFSGKEDLHSTVEVKSCILSEILTRQKMIVDILLYHGADLNSRRFQGGSALHFLVNHSDVYKNRQDLAEFLLKKGANVDAADKDGYTPLHLAIINSASYVIVFPPGEMRYSNYSSFIDLLLKYGANINARSNELYTPLYVAVDVFPQVPHYEEIVTKLLNQPDIDVDLQDIAGFAPLHDALYSLKLHCVKELLNAGANVNVENYAGKSPISSLCKCLHRSIDFDENTLNVCATIVEHVRKLKKLNHFVSEDVEMDLDDVVATIEEEFEEYFSTIDPAIEKEVEKLKSVKIDNYTSLFQILMKDPNSMAKHAKNETLGRIIASTQLQEDFPLFFHFLKKQFKIGLTRNLILESVKKALWMVTKTNWPDTCSERILTYLNNDHLKLLTKSVPVEEKPEDPLEAQTPQMKTPQ